jgi:hypothetical protein
MIEIIEDNEESKLILVDKNTPLIELAGNKGLYMEYQNRRKGAHLKLIRIGNMVLRNCLENDVAWLFEVKVNKWVM